MRSQEILRESLQLTEKIQNDPSWIGRIGQSVETLAAALRAGGTVFFCGNGGSAADAQHLSAELSGRFYYDRPPLKSEALHTNTSHLTAVGNDYGFEQIYSRLLEASGKQGDVLVALSTSGNSPNVVEACRMARHKEMKIIAFTGESGGKLKEWSDILLNVPSLDTPRIQETHILIGHIICELVEIEMFPLENQT